MNNQIKQYIQENELESYVFSTFEEAEKSGKQISIVLSTVEGEDGADIYLTGFFHGLHGEYASWNEDEIEEEELDLERLFKTFSFIIRNEKPEEVLKNMGFSLTPYL